MSENSALFANLDALLDASMDDLDDLPPVGVPPTGHYNLTVTFGIKEIGEGESKKEVICAEYCVDAVNELKDEAEASEVAVGQKFMEFFHITKRDGTPNTFGIGKLKESLKPFVERAGTSNIRELINTVNQWAITAELKRKVNPKNEDQFNMSLKNVVLL